MLQTKDRVADWIFFKKEPTICCLQEPHFKTDNTQVQNEGMEKDLMQTEMTSGGCNNQIRQNKLENKGQKEIYNNKRINIRRGFYTHQHTCT